MSEEKVTTEWIVTKILNVQYSLGTGLIGVKNESYPYSWVQDGINECVLACYEIYAEYGFNCESDVIASLDGDEKFYFTEMIESFVVDTFDSYIDSIVEEMIEVNRIRSIAKEKERIAFMSYIDKLEEESPSPMKVGDMEVITEKGENGNIIFSLRNHVNNLKKATQDDFGLVN